MLNTGAAAAQTSPFQKGLVLSPYAGIILVRLSGIISASLKKHPGNSGGY